MQRIKEFGQEGMGTSIKIQAPKTATSLRRIPIPDTLFSLLKENRQPPAHYLIAGRQHAFAETRTVQYRFASILKKCGIAHFKFHMLRHYFASLCIRRGFDVKSLSEILGHSNVQITLNLYVHSTMHFTKGIGIIIPFFPDFMQAGFYESFVNQTRYIPEELSGYI